MISYISILRGINVGGHNKIKMNALREMLIDAGFNSVQTYIQSGNIIFKTKKTSASVLEKNISAEIERQFGLIVPVLVIELDELKKVADNNPFAKDKAKNIDYLHVTFLSGVPLKENINQILPGNFLPDEFIVMDKVIYLHCPNGYGNTKLNNNFFESKLKLTATTRNWKTVNELLKMIEHG